MKIKKIVLALAFSIFANAAESEEAVPTKKTHELFESLDYPELQVVPLASRRLKIEASEEEKNWWYVHWPLQVSALSTLLLPIITDTHKKTDLDAQQKSDYSTAKTGTMALGATWLAGTVWIGLRKPYSKGYREVRSVKKKDRRSRLLRERLAEEALQKQAKLMKKLNLLSAITNSAASIYISTFVEDTGTLYAAASAIIAFLPLWMENRHIFTYKKHIEYKKNIYAPVTRFQYVPKKKADGFEFYPSIQLAWNF